MIHDAIQALCEVFEWFGFPVMESFIDGADEEVTGQADQEEPGHADESRLFTRD